jgi:hypothetical protein
MLNQLFKLETGRNTRKRLSLFNLSPRQLKQLVWPGFKRQAVLAARYVLPLTIVNKFQKWMDNMFLRLGSFALALVFSMSASASLVNIDYLAHITEVSGDGLGHNLGDQIVGHFVIDTSKAEGDNLNSPTDSMLYGFTSSGLLQSNFASDQDNGYLDFVTVSNDNFYSQDQLSLTKVLSTDGSTLDSLGIGFYFLNLDWIKDLALNDINIDFSDSGSLAYSDGAFARFDMMNSWLITDMARFDIDSVKIASATVPEPSPIFLFAFGVLALLIRRKMM